MKMAQQRLSETSQTAFNDLITGAVQPMMAYQQWLQRMMLGGDRSSSGKSGDEEKS